jgi:c-di-GMP-binding flagellar brake protein YcgR
MKNAAQVSLTPLVDVALDDFRIAAPRRIEEMLNRLLIEREPVALHAHGAVLTARLVAVDKDDDKLRLDVARADQDIPGLLKGVELIAVALLDNIKMQFDLKESTWVRNGQHDLIDCKLPRELFRFQRRDAFRVRLLWCDTPKATVTLPGSKYADLQLRVVDVSLGGCALLLPQALPLVQEASLLLGVAIALDVDTAFCVDLRVRNVTPIAGGNAGDRLGCEFVNPQGDVQRLLQRYLFDTERRRCASTLVNS